VVGVLSAVVIAAFAVGGYGWWTYQQVDRIDLDLADVASGEPRNYLVIGSDSRAEITRDDPNSGVMLGNDAPGGQRSDSIAILRVDPDSERIDVLSIPRDLWVTLPDGSQQRINAAYAESTQTLIDTIDETLDVPIHHFAEVDFTGFQHLIDSLGGVPMYFDSPVRDPNSGLRVSDAGCVVLDGTQGLAFARSRSLEYQNETGWHTDPSGDLGRMTRQQLLMRASLSKARSMGLSNVGRLKGLIDAGLESTTVDSGLGFGDILALGQRFSDFDPQRLQTHALAVEPFRTDGGAAVLSLDEAGSAETLALFRGGGEPTEVTTTTVPPPRPGDVTVAIYNAGGIEGEARRVSYVLSEGGFGLDEVATSPDPTERTTVSHAPGAEAMATLVAGWLGPEPKIVEDEDLPPGMVVVELGEDFESVSEPSGIPESQQPDSSGDSSDGETSDIPDSSTAPTGGTGSAPTTTTTTVVGWTPGVAPEGVECA
jgi:LCP family protein required for cell wall assembly